MLKPRPSQSHSLGSLSTPFQNAVGHHFPKKSPCLVSSMSGTQLSANSPELSPELLPSLLLVHTYPVSPPNPLSYSWGWISIQASVQAMLEEPRLESQEEQRETSKGKVTLTLPMQPRSGPLPVPFLESPYLKGQG